jgi:hypothetical protein
MLEGGAAALSLLAAILANLAGMGWLALSMNTHWRQVRNTERSRGNARRLRILGGLALTAGLALCLWVDHASMAVLVWIMCLTVAALTTAFTLTWRPNWLKPLAWVAGRQHAAIGR